MFLFVPESQFLPTISCGYAACLLFWLQGSWAPLMHVLDQWMSYDASVSVLWLARGPLPNQHSCHRWSRRNTAEVTAPAI